MTCRCGATVSIESTVVNYMAKDWQKSHEDCKYLELQPITATPTPTAPMTETPWGVEELTALTTQPSSPSDQADTESGPAEPPSACVHSMIVRWSLNLGVEWCEDCGVLMYHGRIVVPAVDRTSSTSAKQPSNESVDLLAKVSAESPSSKWNNMCRMQVLQDSHCILQTGHPGPHQDSTGQLVHQFDGRK